MNSPLVAAVLSLAAGFALGWAARSACVKRDRLVKITFENSPPPAWYDEPWRCNGRGGSRAD